MGSEIKIRITFRSVKAPHVALPGINGSPPKIGLGSSSQNEYDLKNIIFQAIKYIPAGVNVKDGTVEKKISKKKISKTIK